MKKYITNWLTIALLLGMGTGVAALVIKFFRWFAIYEGNKWVLVTAMAVVFITIMAGTQRD